MMHNMILALISWINCSKVNQMVKFDLIRLRYNFVWHGVFILIILETNWGFNILTSGTTKISFCQSSRETKLGWSMALKHSLVSLA